MEFACRAGDGCVGGILCIRDALRMCRESPGKQVLVVTFDFMSMYLGRIPNPDDRAAILNACLFADGFAAFTVGPRTAGPGLGLHVLAQRVQWLPGTMECVLFEHHLTPPRVRIGKELPHLARTRSGDAVDAFLAEQGLDRSKIGFWMIHPGGRAILEGFQHGIGLTDEQMRYSMSVMRDFGNIGTSASMFVMKAVCDSGDPKPGDLGVMVTVGPGVTMAMMLVRWEE